MVSTGVKYLVTHHGRQEFCKCDGTPDHQQDKSEKPFQQIYLIGPHQLKTHKNDENRYDKCRKTKVDGDEFISYDSTDGTAIICKLMIAVQPFTWSEVFKNALVGLTC